MLKEINSSLKALERSYMLTFREVSNETSKLDSLLNKFKKNNDTNNLNKSEIINIASTIEELSIKNEFKLSLIKDFPEYFSNIRIKK
ncbi:MAG: hypothetical protein VX089_01255 [Pseudomonadota bacterium]|nr:hypothetical protein [Pseudomonadota bacterium]